MKLRFSLPVLAVLGAVALSAQAQTSIDSAQLRAKQRAEVRAAVAAGEIPRGEAPFGDLRPPQSLRARADVKRDEGDGYRSEQIVSVKSRVEVRAETREAMRLGLIPRGELNPVASEAQLEQVRLAGERALSMSRAVAAR
jgi:hypothetical protein